ncbi:unnamed protein product [Choristocarpus tenellus]
MRNLTEEEREEYQESFNIFDKNGDGTIDQNELRVVLRSLGYSPTSRQLEEMISKVDENKDGVLTFDEFVNMMLAGDVETDREMEIKEAFNFFDKNGDGEITPEELAQTMRGLGDTLSDEEIALLVKEADKNHDGVVSTEEFIAFMYSEGVDSKEGKQV